MYLNKYFNAQNIDLYIKHLKNTARSDSSIKRKVSSLSSFQKFLIRKKYLDAPNVQLAYSKSHKNTDKNNILNKIKNIFAIQEVYPVQDPEKS